MWTDVLDLNEFYASTQGQMTVRLLRARLRDVWPNVRGETVLGLGYAAPFLREIWRVMADGGRLVTVVPTRAGLWSQLDRSPFYQGHPYSPAQVSHLLRANMFAPMRQARALYMPPTRSRLMMRMAPAFERFGQRWLGRFAGVSVIESGKQLYAGIAERHTQPELAVVRPKLRIASSRDTQAARNAEDGEAPAS